MLNDATGIAAVTNTITAAVRVNILTSLVENLPVFIMCPLLCLRLALSPKRTGHITAGSLNNLFCPLELLILLYCCLESYDSPLCFLHANSANALRPEEEPDWLDETNPSNRKKGGSL